jgi:hypothetical protein
MKKVCYPSLLKDYTDYHLGYIWCVFRISWSDMLKYFNGRHTSCQLWQELKSYFW